MATVKSKKTLVGLDIGSTEIKAVELSPSPASDKGYVVTGYGIREINPQQPLKDTIKEMFETQGFQTKKVVTSVSGRSVIVRYIMMPEMTDEELRNAIKYEASKYIPFEVDEVILDCMRLPEVKKTEDKPSKEMRVLLVAAKRQVVDEHVALLEESGLWSVIVDVDCFALGNGLEFHERLNPSSSVGDKVTALVDVGASKTNVNIMYGLNSCFTRDIYIAGNDFTEAITKKMGLQPSQSESLKRDPGIKAEEIKEVVSSVVDDLCHEVSLSFDYFEHQFDKPIDYIYLSGGGSQLVGLEETLERTFEKKPIRWDPCEMLEISSETVDAVEFKKNAVRLAIATGLAARIQKD